MRCSSSSVHSVAFTPRRQAVHERQVAGVSQLPRQTDPRVKGTLGVLDQPRHQHTGSLRTSVFQPTGSLGAPMSSSCGPAAGPTVAVMVEDMTALG